MPSISYAGVFVRFKRGLDLRKIFTFAQISPQKPPKTPPKVKIFKTVTWHLFKGDLSQIEKLS